MTYLRWCWAVLATLGSMAHAAEDSAADLMGDAERIPALSLQPLDVDKLASEDALRDSLPGPFRFAIAKPVDLSPANAGQWQALEDGRWRWRMRFDSSDAAHLNFGFTKFWLPPSATLHFVSLDWKFAVGPFGAERNNAEGVFFSPIVQGQDSLIVLTVDGSEKAAVELHLTQVNHGYRGFGVASKACKSGSCNTDVACLPPGNPWNEPRRSVGAITRGGTDTCTGSLLNNTSGNRDLLFSSATHCGLTAATASTVVVYWNYEFATCRTPGSTASGAAPGPKPTDPWNIQTGATFLAATTNPFAGGAPVTSSDFTLLRLNGTADSRANLYWAGWDRSSTPAVCARTGGPDSSEGLCASIHHPGVDEKRISFVQQNFQIGNIASAQNVHWRSDWTYTPAFPTIPGSFPQTTISITEGGSSGSPLYNAQRRLVGVLSGGPSSCTATDKWDFYGGLFHAWDGVPGATAAQRMRDHLDPAGTNPLFIDGRGQCTAPDVPVGLTVTANGDNRIDLSWTASSGAERYRVFRARGACPGSGYQQIGEVTGTTFSDTTASGGIAYSYRVTSFDDSESCESAQSSCQSGQTTGACRLPPVFTGASSAQSAQTASCAINLNWTAGSADCPAATNLVYNVYRGTSPTFAPSAANRIANCLTGTTYSDTTALGGEAYHYIVRAEDDLSGGGGQCRNGNEDVNLQRRVATATGPDTVLLSDDASSLANWTADGTGGGVNFALVTSSFQSAPSSLFAPNSNVVSDRRLGFNQAVVIPANATGYTLEFFHRFFLEANWDGGVLEYSLDGGTTWSDILAAQGSVPANPSRFLTGGYTGPLNAGTSANPLAGRAAWHGGATGAPYTRVAVNLADFANQSVRFRWRLGTDGSVSREGWWIDDVRVFAPTACTSGPSDAVFINGFEP